MSNLKRYEMAFYEDTQKCGGVEKRDGFWVKFDDIKNFYDNIYAAAFEIWREYHSEFRGMSFDEWLSHMIRVNAERQNRAGG